MRSGFYSGFFCVDAKASVYIGPNIIPEAKTSVSIGYDLTYPKLKHRFFWYRFFIPEAKASVSFGFEYPKAKALGYFQNCYYIS